MTFKFYNMAEKKEEEIKIVEPGRENDKLTKMAEGVYKTVNEYHDKNELHCLVLMAHKTEELAIYSGKQFTELWANYTTGKEVKSWRNS